MQHSLHRLLTLLLDNQDSRFLSKIVYHHLNKSILCPCVFFFYVILDMAFPFPWVVNYVIFPLLYFFSCWMLELDLCFSHIVIGCHHSIDYMVMTLKPCNQRLIVMLMIIKTWNSLLGFPVDASMSMHYCDIYKP